MNKYYKPYENKPLRRDGLKPEAISSTSPSIDVEGRPVVENENSANLFEDHIREQKK